MHEKRNNQNSCMLPTLKWSIYENRMHFGPIQMCRFDGRKKTNLLWIWLMIHWYIFNRTISNECERMAEIKKKPAIVAINLGIDRFEINCACLEFFFCECAYVVWFFRYKSHTPILNWQRQADKWINMKENIEMTSISYIYEFGTSRWECWFYD